MASNAMFKYIPVISLQADGLLRPKKCLFFTNSGFENLIDWYSLYFWSVLTFKFKMVA